MRMKDFGNTFNINEPQNLEEKINEDTATYNDTDENEDTQLKNKEFVQMYLSYKPELAELAIDNGLSRAILDLMACNMETSNTYIVSQEDLAKVFNKDLRTVRRAIKILKDRDFITIFKEGRENVYFINPRIFCKASASYKQKLVEEYVKINQDKKYKASKEKIDMSVLTDTQQRLVVKKDFSKRHKELQKPDNFEIHKMNEIKTVLSNMTNEQLNVLIQQNIGKKPLTDKEIQKIEAETEQRIKSNQASKEYLEALKQEQEIQAEIYSQENTKKNRKLTKEIEERITTELFNTDTDENDPYGLFKEYEHNPLEYLVDKKYDY